MAPDICNGFDPEIEAEWRKILDGDVPEDLVSSLEAELTEGEPSTLDDELAVLFSDQFRRSERHLSEAADETDVRLRLHRQAREEIAYQILCCQSSLSQFTGWGLGYNTGVDVKRNFLEKQLADLRKERRSLEVRAFDDLRRLRSDLREATAGHDSLRYRLYLMEGEGDDSQGA